MRLNYRKSLVIAGEAERATWTPGADAREQDAQMTRLRDAAHKVAARTGKPCEIYAPYKAGGYLMYVVEPVIA